MKMNIQKSRLAAMVTVMLVVCMMVTAMILPASAAEVEETFYNAVVIECKYMFENFYSGICPAYYFDLEGETTVFANYDKTVVLYPLDDLLGLHEVYCEADCMKNAEIYGTDDNYAYCAVNPGYTDIIVDYNDSFTIKREVSNDPVSSPGLSSTVTKDMLSGVLNEIIDLLPVVIPVMIGFIGLRKGISFLQSVLHSA